jgi:HK97 family phage portal protein
MARSLIGSLLNRAPVPHTHRGTFGSNQAGDVPVENIAQMQNVSTVFAIIDGIASEVAASEWKLWRGDTVDDPERVEVKTHAALSVWRRPNPFYTLAEFLEASQQHYELTGEYWWVLASDSELNGRKITAPWPLELWPIRPDRIKPVPHPTKFISGFVHTLGRDETPLTLDQVIFNKRQNPMTPYRGLSPLGSLVYDLAGDTAAAQYNAVFFKNGAMPGGIIEAQTPLSDDDFDQLMQRWREQHRGTSNAHRVGYLENATFTPASYSRRDMEFVDLRNFSKDTIREAWRFPKSMLGSEAASNRATHEAEKQVFADNIIKPRLRRIRDSLNTDFLPKFPGVGKASTRRLWFDFEDPSPDDRESQRKDQDSNITAVGVLVRAGFDPAAVLEALEMPDIEHTGRLPVTVQIPEDEAEPEPDPEVEPPNPEEGEQEPPKEDEPGDDE